LNFPRGLFILTFGLEIRIVRGVTNLLFDCPLHFVGFALDSVFGAFFHSNSLLRGKSKQSGDQRSEGVVPGLVFVAGLDGRLSALSTFDGHQIWAYDTTQEVKTVNGLTARGGSIGSAGATIAGDMVFVPSGYTGFQGGQQGNLLLAFGPPAQ
jgi:hypothetical protein